MTAAKDADPEGDSAHRARCHYKEALLSDAREELQNASCLQ
jgi:hypothetical protein